MTCDLSDVVHISHAVSLDDTAHHYSEDGDMMTFVDDATCYFGHQDPSEVTRVTSKNFADIELHMHANKLGVNSDKKHFLVVTSSVGAVLRGQEAAERREALSLTAGGERIKQTTNFNQ